MERVRRDPGAPFKDSALEGRLAEAHERLDGARNDLQESQGKLQDLIADRDARIRGAIPSKTGGFLGLGQRDISRSTDTPLGSSEYKKAIVAGETANTPENQAFDKDARGLVRDAGKATSAEARESAKIKGLEAAEEEGRRQQGPINEEKRDARLFPLRERETAAQGRLDVQNAGMEAAAEEIARRQGDISGRYMPPMPAGGMPGMGASTGKGGGGGLIGAVTGKGGGQGAPGAQGQPAASPGPSGPAPTVGQAIGPDDR